MKHCYNHPICSETYVQSSDDVDLLLKCMVERGSLRIDKDGKYRSNYAWVKENGSTDS